METIVNNKTVVSRTNTEFVNATNKLFQYLKNINDKYDFIEFNLNLDEAHKSITEGIINSNMGSARTKRLKRYFNRIDFDNVSLKRINTLLHVLSWESNIKLKVRCPKHEEIQRLRKSWLKLNRPSDESLKAYLAYKDKKGDFYKKLSKNVFL